MKRKSPAGGRDGGYSPSYNGNPGTEPTFAPIQTVFLDLESVVSMMWHSSVRLFCLTLECTPRFILKS